MTTGLVSALPADIFQIAVNYANEPNLFLWRKELSELAGRVDYLFGLNTSQFNELQKTRESMDEQNKQLIDAEAARRNTLTIIAYQNSRHGDIKIFKNAYEFGDGNCQDILQRTFLGCARGGHAKLVTHLMGFTRKLLCNNADFEEFMGKVATHTIQGAALSGSLLIVQDLFPFLKGRDEWVKQVIEQTLEYAGKSGSLELINWLISISRQRNNSIDIGLVCTGAIKGRHFDLAKTLIEREKINVHCSKTAIQEVIQYAAIQRDIPTLHACATFAKEMGLSIAEDCHDVGIAAIQAVEEEKIELFWDLVKFLREQKFEYTVSVTRRALEIATRGENQQLINEIALLLSELRTPCSP